MISKNAFIKIMDGLRDYWDALSVDMSRLNVVFEDNHLTRVFDNTMDALCEDLESSLDLDRNDTYWCYYFAFECDWGRKDMVIMVDGVEHILKTAGQLYDLLMLLNEMEG